MPGITTVIDLNIRLSDLIRLTHAKTRKWKTIKCKLCDEDLKIPLELEDGRVLSWAVYNDYLCIGYDQQPFSNSEIVSNFDFFYHSDCITTFKIVPDRDLDLNKRITRL